MATKKNVEEVVVEDVAVEVEETIFENGPTVKEVDEWKGKYGQIYMTEVTDEDAFIWRALNRRDYKEIMKIEEVDGLYREEVVCEKCILWPSGLKFIDMSERKAGIPTILAEQIMDKSGFQSKSEAIPL